MIQVFYSPNEGAEPSGNDSDIGRLNLFVMILEFELPSIERKFAKFVERDDFMKTEKSQLFDSGYTHTHTYRM